MLFIALPVFVLFLCGKRVTTSMMNSTLYTWYIGLQLREACNDMSSDTLSLTEKKNEIKNTQVIHNMYQFSNV